MQRAFVEVALQTLRAKPKIKLEAQGNNKCRDAMIILTEHRSFDLFIMICILANTFVLGFNWYM